MKTSQFKKQYNKYKKKHSITKSTPPLEKHSSHRVEIQLVQNGKHSAKYYCLDCNTWVSWLSQRDTTNAIKLGLVPR